MPNSGTDSSSSDGSDSSASNSNSSNSIQLRRRSPGAGEQEGVAAAFSPDADVVEPPFPPGSGAIGGDWTHDERADTVRKYFASAPRLPDPSGLQVALFKRVSQDIRRNPDWLNDEECSICMSGPKPKVVLSCGCRHKLFHIKCVQEWHEKEDASWQRPDELSDLQGGGKAAQRRWVTPSATETATQKERRKTEEEGKGEAGRS
ncbi:hypothetical protein B0H14DRAFT_3511699 [Mycena olivaceomarginata]|nr:hypothetical protein B0H14DRAFT_3511699 [Mycena olivaceomarginata]